MSFGRGESLLNVVYVRVCVGVPMVLAVTFMFCYLMEIVAFAAKLPQML